MAAPEEVNRDCNTCRHHRQARSPLSLTAHAIPISMGAAMRELECSLCLTDLALNGELSKWEPELDPTKQLEA